DNAVLCQYCPIKMSPLLSVRDSLVPNKIRVAVELAGGVWTGKPYVDVKIASEPFLTARFIRPSAEREIAAQITSSVVFQSIGTE
ncbi:hypothetical protein, partial [Klebsiella pneumoniae]|uniref:hypothetical protein n=1 Tax=Klebsiella pneumoniae TaxID=573 RepID=UPI001C5829AB